MNVEIIKHLSTADPILADIIPRVELSKIAPSEGVYHDLVSCIIDQQVPSRSRGVYMKKLVGLLGGESPNTNNIYTIQEDDWSAAKMARPKYHTLFRLTDAWHEQKMDTWNWDGLSDKEVRTRLQAIKGIGPQTVDMILLYTLRRSDVFPLGDYHVKQIMETLYLEEGEKLKSTMLSAAAKWAPYRSYATRYLLAYKAAMKKR